MKSYQSIAFLKTHRATFNRRCAPALLLAVMILSFAGWRAGASREIANGNMLVRLKSWSGLDAATPSKPNMPAIKDDAFNPTGAVAVSGAALNFDGTDDYVNLGTGLSSAFNGTNKITIQAWVYPTALGGLKSVISNLNISGGTPTYWMRMNNEGKMQFSLETTSGGVTVTTGTTLSLNAWKHITATWDGSTIRIYVNGVPDGSEAQSGSFPAGSNTVTLGISYFDTTQEQWQGALDEVRVWNSALCEAEILARYNCELAGTETGLLAYYKFNQGMANADNSGATTLTDSSPNGRNGTLSGFALTGATSNWVEPGGVTSGNSCVTNAPPTITAVGVTRAAGVTVSNSQIATVNDAEDAENTLTVQVNDAAMATVNGVTVSNLAVSVAGVVTANVVADCMAGTAMFTLKVTDSGGLTATATLTVTVAANLPPILSYNATNVVAGSTPVISPAIGPSDNGTINPLVLQPIVPATGLTLSLNPASGQLQVTGATLAGNYTVTVTATDNCGATTNAQFTVTVACPTVSLSPASLPNATINTAYPQTIGANPAGGNYSFAVTSGLLPTGLTLNSNGSFSGAPTQSGAFNFRVTASGFGSCSAFQDYTLVVNCSPITLAPTSLPGGNIGTTYNQSVSAAPAGTYNYAVSSRALPPGLSLNAATGAINGTPTTGGNFNFTVTASQGGCNGSQSYSVTIACAAIMLNPTSPLANGLAGTAYSQTISASPAGSYTYSIALGNLPSGLSLNPTTGVISGTPTVANSFTFRVTASGFGGCTGFRDYTVTIGGGGCPTITLPTSLPNAAIGGLYSQGITASPAGSYSYAVTSGALPPGTTLYTSFGLLLGYPSAAGSYTFTVTATLGACTASQSYTVLVSASFASALSVGSDFDGDLKSDLSIFRADGNWEVSTSRDGKTETTLWGAPYAPHNDLVVSGDYDGDGKTDQAVFRRGTEYAGYWFIKKSSDCELKHYFWGLPTDVPTPGDYDGDGKTDAAVFRKSNGHWYVKRSSNDKTLDVHWGLGTDVPVPGDYDGDAKTDYAVWRASEGAWYWVGSDSAALKAVTLGAAGDVPVPTDYDGDGKADTAVWQAATGNWQIVRSRDGKTISRTYGRSGDTPVPARRN